MRAAARSFRSSRASRACRRRCRRDRHPARRSARRSATARTETPGPRPPRPGRGARRGRRAGSRGRPARAVRAAAASSPRAPRQRACCRVVALCTVNRRPASASTRTCSKTSRALLQLVPLEVQLDHRHPGIDPPGLVAAQPEDVGRLDRPHEPARRLGATRLPPRRRTPRRPGCGPHRRPRCRRVGAWRRRARQRPRRAAPAWMWARAVVTCSRDSRPRFGGLPSTASTRA